MCHRSHALFRFFRPCPPPRSRVALRAAIVALGIVTGFAPAASAQTPGPHAPAAGAAEVKPPTVDQHVDAVYPASALASRKHGDVVLLLTVDQNGHVSKVDVASSGGADLR